MSSHSNQEGQSTVEFILSMTLIVGFIFFLLQLSLVMAYANYAQYVTFMAARAYLSAGPSQADQQQRAVNVIAASLKKPGNPGAERLPMIARGTGGGAAGATGLTVGPVDANYYDPTNQDYSWMQGVRYAFNGKIFIFPIGTIKPGANSLPRSLTFTTETYLGREPAYMDCSNDMTSRGGNAAGGNAGATQAYYDNGC